MDRALADLARRLAVEVVGEPGIGKTRLLAELGATADARGMLVLSGSASELERGMPFWVFVDALDEYVRGPDPRRLDGVRSLFHKLGVSSRVDVAREVERAEALETSAR